MERDSDIREAMDDAIASGGREEQYKDLTRKATRFGEADKAQDQERYYKDQRRSAAHQRRASLRKAYDRAAGSRGAYR